LRVRQIFDAAGAAGVTLSVDSGSLLLRSGCPAPQELIDALSRHKSEVIDFLRSDSSGLTAENWRAFFDERAAIAEFDGGLPRHEAESRAFGACVVEWLDRNRACSAQDRCCWCGGGERGDNVLLPFGADRAGHVWLHRHCWQSWHEHRQAQAIAFLRTIGIAVPIESAKDSGNSGGA
jgi:hypothetical protein